MWVEMTYAHVVAGKSIKNAAWGKKIILSKFFVPLKQKIIRDEERRLTAAPYANNEGLRVSDFLTWQSVAAIA